MYKICVVGLGGSGGKTLQFLMDQLRSELSAKGWTADHLPRCWEFVHIDVPSAPDGVGPGLPQTVPAQGGTYIPVSNPTDSYAVLDAALQTTLSSQPTGSQLRQLARWRPDPGKVTTPITEGAGQYRAVGRLLTLARAGLVYDRLVPVAERLNQSAADSDLRTLSNLLKLDDKASQGTLVFVVSSLAGGTGASMTLDVCNLLRAVAGQVPNFPAEQALAFLYTPDVFERLQANRRAGVNANALGTVAELMSSMAARQTPWTPQEWSVYGGVPQPVKPGRGPLLAFPVGAYNGITGARFGDGASETVYRGFARSLASLFVSEAQQTSLKAYAIGNLESAATSLQDRTQLSVQPARHGAEIETTEPLVFGSIGFASLGLGRDRYAEYAAQRLARRGLERLLRGHWDITVHTGERSPQQAVAATAAEYYPQFLQWAGLPDLRLRDTSYLRFLVDDVWSAQARETLAANSTSAAVAPAMVPGYSAKGAHFAQQLAGLINQAFHRVTGDAEAELREAAAKWVQDIQVRLEKAALLVAGERGLPVAERVLETLASDLQAAADQLTRNSATTLHPQEIAADVTGELQTVTAAIDANHGVVGRAVTRIRQHFGDLFVRKGAALAGDLLAQLGTDLLPPLRTGLQHAREALEAAERATVGAAPVSTVATTEVQQWPVGEDVPGRFATAENEVLLEDIAGYPRSFADQLVQTFNGFAPGGGAVSAERAEELAVFETLTWLHADVRGGVRPAGRLTGLDTNGSPVRIGRRSEWWPQALASVNPSRRATYRVGLDAAALLDGARAWVNRPDQVMGGFIQQGLDAYLRREGAGVHEREELARHFVDRFEAALQLAAPLVAVDTGMVQAVHDVRVEVTYQFGEVPLTAHRDVVERMADALRRGAIDHDAVERLHHAVTEGPQKRIDILGNYAGIYNPVVYSSLQRPIRKQWTESNSPQLRGSFWRWRRGRSLTDFAPVSRTWLQSMVTGWLVGRLTGEVLMPGEGPILDGGVAVWSEELRTFTRLPHPLLGAEDPARDAPGWGLLAAVVESLPLALALCDGNTQLPALQPYQALFQLGRFLQSADERQPNDALLSWIRDGRTRSGALPWGESPVVATPEQRLAEAREWCASLREDATSLLPPDASVPGPRGEFSTVSPHNFWKVPRDWEIAPQLLTASTQLLANLELPDYTGIALAPQASSGITRTRA
ncbi:tubulin-like doman-containing protein [Geodermatophilus sp. SYSU D01045]